VVGGRILAQGKDKGAGFAVAPRLVLTANHVVRGQEESSLQFVGETAIPINIMRVRRAEELDIALLYLTNDASDVLSVCDGADELEWRVEMEPRGNDPWLTGVITASRRRFTNQQKHQTEAMQLRVNELLQEYAGYSGSPVILKASPRMVVGVLVEELRMRIAALLGQSVPASNVLYAIPVRQVIDRFALNVTLHPAPTPVADRAVEPFLIPRPSRLDPTVVSNAERELAELPTDVVPAPSSLPGGSRMPHSANPLFVGRESELRALAKALKAPERVGSGQLPVTIATGPGGIGKTQLTVEFVHRYGRFFAGGVFWLNFADPAAVPTEIASSGLGEALGLRQDFASLPVEERVALVMGAWQNPIPSLLVFDNCEDPALLEMWRPKSGGARVLVTTRKARWNGTAGLNVLTLGYLPADDSVAFLAAAILAHKDRSKPLDDRSLRDIAEELGYLPLALHLAGSNLALYGDQITPAEYLSQLRGSNQFEALDLADDEFGVSPTRHVQSVKKTIALSYQRLEPTNERDMVALTLLSRAARLAPGEPIPRSLLSGTVAEAKDTLLSPLRFEKALGRLIDLGLLEDAAKAAVRMHRLVAAFVRQISPGDDAEASVERGLLDAVGQQGAEGDPNLSQALQSHLRFITDAAANRTDERAAALRTAVGTYLRSLGDYRRAKQYFEQALNSRLATLGERHRDTVASLNDVGFMLKDLGLVSAAQPYFERALKIHRSEGEREALVTSLNDLGFVLKDQGKFAEARRSFQQALKTGQAALGKAHSSALVSLNNLGLAYKDEGKLKEAQRCFEESLSLAMDARGREHPDTVASLHNLAWVLVDRGLRAQARPYLDRALTIQRKAFGDEDSRTAESFNALGELLIRQGDFKDTVRPDARRMERDPVEPPRFFEEAEEHFKKALAIQRRALGENHPATVGTLASLGKAIYKKQKIERGQPWPDWDAESSLRQAYEFFERTFGPVNKHTLELRAYLDTIDSEKERIRGWYIGE
jgi:tetratricopeptide (TPR) repeat protein